MTSERTFSQETLKAFTCDNLPSDLTAVTPDLLALLRMMVFTNGRPVEKSFVACRYIALQEPVKLEVTVADDFRDVGMIVRGGSRGIANYHTLKLHGYGGTPSNEVLWDKNVSIETVERFMKEVTRLVGVNIRAMTDSGPSTEPKQYLVHEYFANLRMDVVPDGEPTEADVENLRQQFDRPELLMIYTEPLTGLSSIILISSLPYHVQRAAILAEIVKRHCGQATFEATAALSEKELEEIAEEVEEACKNFEI